MYILQVLSDNSSSLYISINVFLSAALYYTRSFIDLSKLHMSKKLFRQSTCNLLCMQKEFILTNTCKKMFVIKEPLVSLISEHLLTTLFKNVILLTSIRLCTVNLT